MNISYSAQGESSTGNTSTIAAHTSQSALDGESPEFTTLKLFLYFTILSFTTLGNGCVFYILMCNRRLFQASSNMLLLNLSACDFLTPLLSIPFDLALEERGYVWPYGAALCRVLWPSVTFTATASAFTLAVISLDRFRILMHPFTPRLTKRQIKRAVLGIYVFSLLLVIPYIIFLRLEDDACVEQWPRFEYRQAYTVVLFLAQYAVPLIFMTIVYALALSKLYSTGYKTLRMRSMEHENLRENTRSSNNDTGKNPRVDTGKNPLRKISSRVGYCMKHAGEMKANVRATKMFIAIVVVFAVFMLPNQALWLWSDFGGGHHHVDLNTIKIVCWLFTYTNCVCNPVIFMIFGKDFRAAFLKLFNSSRQRLSFSRSSGPDTECTHHVNDPSPVTSLSALNEQFRASDEIRRTSSC